MKKQLLILFIFASLFNTPIKSQSTDYYNRLYYTCKAWGYLKYFHSEIAKGNLDWDAILLEKIYDVKNSNSGESFNNVLTSLITAPGETAASNTDPPEIPEDLRYNLNLNWFNDHVLNPDNRAALENIRNKFRPRKNYYVEERFQGGNPSFDKDNKYYEYGVNEYPEEGKRLLALFRYWNIINYFYPYKNLMDQDWDTTLAEFIPKFVEAHDKKELHLTFLELATRLNDSHGFTYSNTINYEIFGTYYLPLEFKSVENETVVFKNLSNNSGIKVGDVVKSINNVSVQEIRNNLTAITVGSNQPTIERNINNYLQRGPNEDVKIILENDNGEKEVILKRISANDYSELLAENDEPIWKIINYEGKNLGYVDMEFLEREQVDKMFSALWLTDGIIFDVRNYPKGTMWYLINYLYDAPINIANFTTPDLTYPGTLYWNYETIGTGDFSKTYDKSIYLLFDEETQSQAEYTIMGLEQHPKAIKIGSQTAGADGNVSLIYLPGGIVTYFTGLGVFYPDGRETQRIGIVPDIEVHPTIKELREGKDEVLEKVFDILPDSQNEPDNKLKIMCYPNPFTTNTVIEINTQKEGNVSVIICDVLGQQVKKLYDSNMEAGKRKFIWEGINGHNAKVSNGIYIVSLKLGDETVATKLLLIK